MEGEEEVEEVEEGMDGEMSFLCDQDRLLVDIWKQRVEFQVTTTSYRDSLTRSGRPADSFIVYIDTKF
jgi:hypothetical protein